MLRLVKAFLERGEAFIVNCLCSSGDRFRRTTSASGCPDHSARCASARRSPASQPIEAERDIRTRRRHRPRAQRENPRRADSARRRCAPSRPSPVRSGGAARPHRSARRIRWRVRRRRHRARTARRSADRAATAAPARIHLPDIRSRNVGSPLPSFGSTLSTSISAEYIGPGVVGGDPNAGACAACAGEKRRVGAPSGRMVAKIDAGVSARRPRATVKRSGSANGSAVASAVARSPARRPPSRGRAAGSRRNPPSAPRRARRRDTIRAS